MYKLTPITIRASEIASYLQSRLQGEDLEITKPSSVEKADHGSLICLEKLCGDCRRTLASIRDCLVITSIELHSEFSELSYVVVENPRLAFAEVINEFFVELEPNRIDESAILSEGAKIGRNVSIAHNVVIGPDVSIGNNTIILNNVVITGRTFIGSRCLIKDNSTIGSEGYDFEIDSKGRPIHTPHIGEIRIGDNVWIGSNTTIESPFIKTTLIEDNVKIDDLVQIGSEAIVQKNSLITAGVILSNNVVIGEGCVLGPNTSVREYVVIENNVQTGIGAVVIRNLEQDGIYVGNPSRLLRKRGENIGGQE